MPIAQTTHHARSPRRAREAERIARAGATARANGQRAMAVALAEIGAAFDETAAINDFKLRVERLARLPPGHLTLRRRFGARAELLAGRDLNAAIVTVERWWRDERKAFQIARAFGGGSRLSLEVLSELRLILRLMRRKQMTAEYHAVLSGLCEPLIAEAAE
jgi:hypothetical protein